MNCKLIGNIFQVLEVELSPNELFYAERGALVYMESGIEQEVQMTGNGLANIISSKISGESLFLVKYHNRSSSVRKLAITGRQGSIKHIKVTPGHTLILRRGDYVGSNNKVQVDINFSINKLITGSGFTYQKITGDSTVFFDCVDTLIEKTLNVGEEIIVDEDHLKALYDINDSQISIQRDTNIIKNLISGEGLLMTRIVGPGKVFLSSIPIIRPSTTPRL
jgi:uncharacterized protein (TIGR00266 family)